MILSRPGLPRPQGFGKPALDNAWFALQSSHQFLSSLAVRDKNRGGVRAPCRLLQLPAKGERDFTHRTKNLNAFGISNENRGSFRR